MRKGTYNVIDQLIRETNVGVNKTNRKILVKIHLIILIPDRLFFKERKIGIQKISIIIIICFSRRATRRRKKEFLRSF
jgi:hypothetical protein